jgi:two-component system, OmpR family, response regulator CpxR
MKPKRTILCAGNNEQSLSIRKIMLETRGYRVVVCTGGEEALQRFSNGGVDLLLTELAMPGLDGGQLIAKVKELSPQTPAILISNKIKIYDSNTYADAFLVKGTYAPADLLERVRLLLVRKRGPKRAPSRTQSAATQAGAA